MKTVGKAPGGGPVAGGSPGIACVHTCSRGGGDVWGHVAHENWTTAKQRRNFFSTFFLTTPNGGCTFITTAAAGRFGCKSSPPPLKAGGGVQKAGRGLRPIALPRAGWAASALAPVQEGSGRRDDGRTGAWRLNRAAGRCGRARFSSWLRALRPSAQKAARC